MAIPFKKYDSEDEKLKNTLVSTGEGTAAAPLYTPGENVPGETAGTPITDNGREQYYAGANAENDESKEKNYPRYQAKPTAVEKVASGKAPYLHDWFQDEGVPQFRPTFTDATQTGTEVSKSAVSSQNTGGNGVVVAPKSVENTKFGDVSGGRAEISNVSKHGYTYYKANRVDAGEKPTDTYTYEDLYNQYMNSPISKEEEDKRKRAASQISGIKALGNVANAFSNLVFTGHGAPSQTLPQLADPDLQAYSDKLNSQRMSFIEGRARMSELDRARNNDSYNRWLEATKYNNEQGRLENESRNAGMAWDAQRGDRADDVAYRNDRAKTADKQWQEQFAEQKHSNKARERLAANANSARQAYRNYLGKKAKEKASGVGKDFVVLLSPSGVKQTYTAKKFGSKTYLDAAFATAKRQYPHLYEQYKKAKLDTSNQMLLSAGGIPVKDVTLSSSDKTEFISAMNSMVQNGEQRVPAKYIQEAVANAQESDAQQEAGDLAGDYTFIYD